MYLILHSFQSTEVDTQQHINGTEQLSVQNLLNVLVRLSERLWVELEEQVALTPVP